MDQATYEATQDELGRACDRALQRMLGTDPRDAKKLSATERAFGEACLRYDEWMERVGRDTQGA